MNVTAVKHAIFIKPLSLFYNHDFSPSHYNDMETNNTAALNGRGLCSHKVQKKTNMQL